MNYYYVFLLIADYVVMICASFLLLSVVFFSYVTYVAYCSLLFTSCHVTSPWLLVSLCCKSVQFIWMTPPPPHNRIQSSKKEAKIQNSSQIFHYEKKPLILYGKSSAVDRMYLPVNTYVLETTVCISLSRTVSLYCVNG